MAATRFTTLIAITLACLALAGCTSVPKQSPDDAPRLFGVPPGQEIFSDHAPLAAPANAHRDYNRIGRAAARRHGKRGERIYIDPNDPVYYVRRQAFTTPRGEFNNLIYRLHFPRVPHGFAPFHITAGRNGGLFVIVTLDPLHRPVLYTTVHTCGCYLAFIPTNYLPRDAYPERWPTSQQQVYGETLPARLDFPAEFDPSLRPLIRLRDGNHRVMDVELASIEHAQRQPGFSAVTLEPISALDQLPLEGATTSFFHTQGLRRGYVKNASKPWERAFISWWALDFNVGVDKRLGDPQETGRVFYTSLKPWARQRSNLWHFADFLQYWGWRL